MCLKVYRLLNVFVMCLQVVTCFYMVYAPAAPPKWHQRDSNSSSSTSSFSLSAESLQPAWCNHLAHKPTLDSFRASGSWGSSRCLGPTAAQLSHGSQSHGATAATKSALALKQIQCLAMSTWVPLSLITCLASVMRCNSKSSALNCAAYVLHCICAALHLCYTSNLLQSCFSQFKCTPSLSLSHTPMWQFTLWEHGLLFPPQCDEGYFVTLGCEQSYFL